MAKKASSKRIEDPVVRELDAIKRLLILQMYRAGVSQAEIAKALGIDAAELSRMMPARQFADKHGSQQSVQLGGRY